MDEFDMKKYIYLIQSRQYYKYFEELVSDTSDAIVLFWKDFDETELPNRHDWERIDCHKSTWNSGRNVLLKNAICRDVDYEYYIFMDDDIGFNIHTPQTTTTSAFREFEYFLNTYNPAVGCVRGNWHNHHRRELDVCSPHCYDACFNAIHKNLLKIFMPYVEKYDNYSWWWSQEIVCAVSSVIAPNQCMQYNLMEYANHISGPYPRGGDISDVNFANYMIEESNLTKKIIPYPENRNVVYPTQKKNIQEYCLDDLGKMFDLSHWYWLDKKTWWEDVTGEWLL